MNISKKKFNLSVKFKTKDGKNYFMLQQVKSRRTCVLILKPI